MDSIHCSIHLLQLVVEKGLFVQEEVGSLIKKCRKLNQAMSQSTKGCDKLKNAQKAECEGEQREPLLLVKDVETRWNSTFLMMQRILRLKSVLVTLGINNDAFFEPHAFTRQEWELMHQVCTVLAPFFRTTELMSANKISISQVVVIILGLRSTLLQLEAAAEECDVNEMRDLLLREIDGRFFTHKTGGALAQYNISDDKKYVLPYLLNPFFHASMMNRSQTSKAKQWLIEALTELDRSQEEQARRDNLDAMLCAIDDDDEEEEEEAEAAPSSSAASSAASSTQTAAAAG
jgi:hypothetical protein